MGFTGITKAPERDGFGHAWTRRRPPPCGRRSQHISGLSAPVQQLVHASWPGSAWARQLRPVRWTWKVACHATCGQASRSGTAGVRRAAQQLRRWRPAAPTWN